MKSNKFNIAHLEKSIAVLQESISAHDLSIEDGEIEYYKAHIYKDSSADEIAAKIAVVKKSQLEKKKVLLNLLYEYILNT